MDGLILVAPEDATAAGQPPGSAGTAAGETTNGGSAAAAAVAGGATTAVSATSPAPSNAPTAKSSSNSSNMSASNSSSSSSSAAATAVVANGDIDASGNNHNTAAANNSNSNNNNTAMLLTPKKAWSLEEANEEIALLLEKGKVSMQEVNSLQGLMRDYGALQDKVGKLKSLLGRSAKAQREAKVDLEANQKRLDQALREVERLQTKVDVLANRPTHMDLLADFETNFDRALLSVGQAGGQDTAAPSAAAMLLPSRGAQLSASTVEQLHLHQQQQHQHQHNHSQLQQQQHSTYHSQQPEAALVDSMLLQELAEQKNRIDRLEALNSALVHRSSQLEHEAKEFRVERDQAQQQLSRMQLELRMAKMEADHASRALQDKAASLAEMQMEIDMVTKASLDAQVRAAQGEAAAKYLLTDKQHVQQLESQVQALQEWALASAESKRLAMEQVKILERKVQQYESMYIGGHFHHYHHSNSNSALSDNGGSTGTGIALDSTFERLIMTKSGSLVIGAGDVGSAVIELTSEHVEMMEAQERVLLRWKFDLTSATLGIDFSILKGKCDTPAKQQAADYLIQNRPVVGGAGGETELAFAIQHACTLLWSNARSWVRPRTVKYTIEAVAVRDD